MTAMFARRGAVLAFVLWGLAIAIGWMSGIWYETTPTATGVVSDRWPPATTCVLSADRPTLLMFVHPHCPCTRSSLGELALMMKNCQGLVDAQVLFYMPRSSGENWAKTDLWKSAARIPGVAPKLDLAGNEHRRFRARVSGEVFLFQPSSELSFHGGITSGRGHAGDNQGRSALEAILLQRQPGTTATPVFGCGLENSALTSNRLPSVKQRRIHD